MSYNCLSAMHRGTADRLGPRVALRYKRHGLYHDVSWASYREQADALAAGLMALGVQRGDRIGILSENRVEWLITDIGIITTGAADVPNHAPLAAKQVEYQLQHSAAKGVFVSNQVQADKILEGLGELPDLEFMISYDPIVVGGRIQHLSFQALMSMGRLRDARQEVLERERSISRDDLATIMYTSGTTGNPKGVMLTHGNMLCNAEAMLEVSQIGRDDILLSWLPYSHIYARMVDHYATTFAQSTVCLAESVDTLLINLAETQPTWLTAVPRFYEKVWSMVEKLPTDIRSAQLKRVFGRRLRYLSSGGAPLPKHIGQGFHEAGILLLEGYGLTESAPVLTFNRPDSNRIGSVGKPLSNVTIKIAEDGEILASGPNIMKGYLKNPEATAEAIREGWLHTGDVGYLDADGYLFITDRKKDLIVTSSGKNIAPSELERLLVSDPLIDQAVVYGDGRNFLTALLVPNFELLKAKAEEHQLSIEMRDGFITSEAIHQLLRERVDLALKGVSRTEQVKKFLILAQPFTMDAGEVTATLKIRRRHVIDKYKAQLEALYADASSNGD